MLFNSLTFLIFFLLVLVVHSLPLSWRARKLNLLLASYLFYAAWNPPFVALLWLSTGVDWVAARRMAGATSAARRRAWLLLSLFSNLALLSVFKYGDFLLETFTVLAAPLGISFQPLRLDILLPVGISFYTFQTLSYAIDVYRGQRRPWPSLLDFALFVTFFPQLVAGPIVRAGEFLPQCITPRRATGAQLGLGFTLLLLGLFQKVILADSLAAPVAGQVFDSPYRAGFTAAWVGTLAFSAQIFFDFAGYSTCARGAALCLGFGIPYNFHYPYAAVGFSDFWHRWHVSLSGWLRDYLYIPLGGNRKGAVRTQANLMTTMLLGGLWHGAAWRFVAWGGLHGIYLLGERGLRRHWGRSLHLKKWYVQLFLVLLTYSLVCLAWVFFRAQNFPRAWSLVTTMLTGRVGPLGLSGPVVWVVVGLTLVLLAGQWLLRDTHLEPHLERVPWWGLSLLLALLLLSLALTPGEDRAFIYFQF